MSENLKQCPDFDPWMGKADDCMHEENGLCFNNDEKPCLFLSTTVRKPCELPQSDCGHYEKSLDGSCGCDWQKLVDGTCTHTRQACPYVKPSAFSLRQNELKEWQERNFPASLYDHLDRDQLVERIRILELSVGMAEEVGELSHIILKASQKIRDGISGKIDQDLVADGFADTVIYGIQLMTKIGIDAEAVLRKTIDSVLKRDWANNRKDADKNERMPMVSKKPVMKPVTLAYHGVCDGKNQTGDDHPCQKVKRLGIVYARAEMSTFRDCWVFHQCINIPSELPPYLSILE